MLSKFWLVNGAKKHGKKSKKKISKKAKSFAKKIKKAAVKKVVIKKVVKKATPRKVVKKVVKERVYIPQVVPSIPQIDRSIEREKAIAKNIFDVNKPIKRGRKIMKKRKSVKKAKRFVPARPKATKSGTHRIVVKAKKGVLRTSRKAKIVKRGLKLNPFAMKLNTRSLMNQIKPVAILGGVSVASMIGINKGMEYIPFVKDFTGIKKSLSKVGAGVVGMIAAKKLIKNQTIANGILLGAVISAIADVLATRNIAIETPTVNGIKAYGNPALQYGRPTAPLGTQSYKGLNGIKVKGVNGVRGFALPAKVETMQGAKDSELY